MKSMDRVQIVHGDALTQKGDVLVLKYAQGFYGVDAAVARLLRHVYPRANMKPKPGRFVVLPTKGSMRVPFVMFLGVVDLDRFDYAQIRSFSYLALQVLKSQLPKARRILMTVHGPGYGLDEKEAFLALYAGLRDAFADGAHPEGVQHVQIVELNRGRVQRLSAILGDVTESTDAPQLGQPIREADGRIEAGAASSRKPHIFVAMPFSEGEMEDIYGFGIQAPVNAAGYLCERLDVTSFTGEIMNRLRERIETAYLVVADLTGANPNVYLEVGYSWGRNKPTVLLAKKGTELKFDVHGNKCLFYVNITDLAKKLSTELTGLTSGPGAA
jgi:hypothetical protein